MCVCEDHKDTVPVIKITSYKGECEICQKLEELERLRQLVKEIREEAENEYSDVEFAHWVKAVINHATRAQGGMRQW